MKYFFRRLTGITIVIGLLVIIGFESGAVAQTPAVDSEEQNFLNLINDYRAQAGLSRLKLSIALLKSSDWLSTDMAMKNYFNHIDSQGRDPVARMQAFGYGYSGSKGENIAAGYSDAATTFQQFKNSPSHNTVMLNPNFNVIGISRAYNAASKYRWYWTTDFGQYVDATVDSSPPPTGQLQTLNAGSFKQSVSPDSLAAAFGTNISSSTIEATALPLPTSMGGVSVTVNGVAAPLVFVSSGQINCVIPSNVGMGNATVNVVRNGAVIATGAAMIESVSPSIFTFGATGKGVPAALTTFDGVSFQTVYNSNGSAKAVSAGTTNQPNYLIMYGTGLRRRSSLSNSRVTIGGVSAEISFIGPHPRFTGLDQVNVKIPATLRGRGQVDVSITIDGKTANIVQIFVQ